MRAPKVVVMTVNAGAIPPGHWTQDNEVGGGRIVGEACHFIDLMRFLVDTKIVDYDISLMAGANRDSASIQLRFDDGSISTIHYIANGAKSFPKERLEIFTGGALLQLNNFRRLTGFDWPGFHSMNLWRQDKGQGACAAAFARSVTLGAPSPILLEEILEVSRVSIELSAVARS